MLNLLISISLLFIIVVCVYRILLLAGVPCRINNTVVTKYLCSPNTITEEPCAREYPWIAAEAFAFRILIYIVSGFFMILFSSEETFQFADFLEHWHQWDASNYIRIATGGYGYWLENGEPTTLVFFPLYSCLVKGMYYIVSDYDLSCLIVSTLCYVGGACYLYGLVSLDYGKRVAKKAVIYLSIFPFGFFFGAMMPESLFLLTSAACLYYIRKRNYLMTAVFGILSALTRLQGILLIIPAGIEWLDHYQPIKLLLEKRVKDFFYSLKKLVYILSMLLGTAIYLLINYFVAGDCFKFLDLQLNVWGHHYEYVGKAVTTIFNYMLGDYYSPALKCALWIPQAFIFTLTIVLLLYGVNKHKPQYTLYLTAYTIISFSASFILSGGRYMSVAIPLFIILAKLLDDKEWAHRLFTAFSLLFMFLYMAGYIFGKQIM